MIQNILLCGVGGQGILLAAKVIAAAAVKSGFEVTTNEIHGMAQRGGSVTAFVRYGDTVFSPLFRAGDADVIASMEAIEALRYAHWLRPGGLAAVSRQRLIPVTVSSGKAKYPADADERLAKVFPRLEYIDCHVEAKKLGDARMANIILLGALSRGLDGIPSPVWEEAIRACVKPQFVEGNLAAFRFGRKE
jgi:indolepyruvate ferredoxin oxidoreductase beta subunit